jgi:hypothetical protein
MIPPLLSRRRPPLQAPTRRDTLLRVLASPALAAAALQLPAAAPARAADGVPSQGPPGALLEVRRQASLPPSNLAAAAGARLVANGPGRGSDSAACLVQREQGGACSGTQLRRDPGSQQLSRILPALAFGADGVSILLASHTRPANTLP